jgi:transcriptional regulator with GAF, ATPase, and Fis domain
VPLSNIMRGLETSKTASPQLSSFGDVHPAQHRRERVRLNHASELLTDLLQALTAAAAALETERESQAFQDTDFYEAVRSFEISLIQRALSSTAGNQAKAARLLHLKQTTLHGKIKQYKIRYRVTVGHESDHPDSGLSS